eukprot:TRINITY_DN121929_c0_g1_i1.p1 TRINITY_DN121929_c0_g1~~TRINITY_DN121929_c0_g1_i1.p1  ORF type:complete len:637 (+),score=170.33 TRINITY_DN121929_c0_g1_i1:66-1976(+)
MVSLPVSGLSTVALHRDLVAIGLPTKGHALETYAARLDALVAAPPSSRSDVALQAEQGTPLGSGNTSALAQLVPTASRAALSFLTGTVATILGVRAYKRRAAIGGCNLGNGRQRDSDSMRGRTAMRVRRAPMPVLREKKVTATKRLPMWMMSEEMYSKRQLAPSPDASWTDIRRTQAVMKERVTAQQIKDMKQMEREISGWRFPPTYKMGELREGMWLDGRVSCLKDTGVLIDVGAYTDRGEWVDGFLHAGQFREDGLYVPFEDMNKEVYLGEIVRVRVRECVPAAGLLTFSMRTREDFPKLFMGQPRPYSCYDLQAGMKVKGIIRRAWQKWAIVDIGSDRLVRIHVRDAPVPRDRYGFPMNIKQFRYAHAAFAVGAEMDFWIASVLQNGQIVTLTAIKPQKEVNAGMSEPTLTREPKGKDNFAEEPEKKERVTREQRMDRDRASKEKETWDPYVAHVDEWLEDAAEPDDATDSWVAMAEKELFDDDEEMEDYKDEVEGEQVGARAAAAMDDDFDDFADEDFAEDEFADEDFGASGNMSASSVISSNEGGFGNEVAKSDLDGWVLDDDGPAVGDANASNAANDDANSGTSRQASSDEPTLSEQETDAFFDAPSDEDNLYDPSGRRSQAGRSSRRRY